MNSLRRSAIYLVTALISSLACNLHSFGQGVPLSMDIARPIPGAGHDYVKGLNETVNPANGALTIKIDFPTFASRGLSLPFSLIYNSGLVHHAVTQVYNSTINAVAMDGAQYEPTDRSINGWSDTVPYATATQWVIGAPPPTRSTAHCNITGSYTLYDATGQSHQLGIAAISPIGLGSGIDQDYCAHSVGYNATMTWEENGYAGRVINGSCDGTNAGSTAPGCPTAAPPFTATDLDNTVYTFPYGYLSLSSPSSYAVTAKLFPPTIEDRNGNIIRITGALPSGNGLTPLIVYDTAGRIATQINYSDANFTPASYDVDGLSYDLGYTTTSANYSANGVHVGPNPISPNICNSNFQINNSGKEAIQTVTLPNGQSYTFKYDPVYGLVNEIDYPNGGWVEYQWGFSAHASDSVSILTTTPTNGTPSYGFCNFEYYSPVVISRKVHYTKTSGAAATQTFSYDTVWNNTANPPQWTSKTATIKTTDNITGKTYQTNYTFQSTTLPQPNLVSGSAPPPPQLAVEKEVVTYDWGPSATAISTVDTIWKDPYAISSRTVKTPSLQSFTTAYQYDINDRPTQKDEYDFGSSNIYRTTKYFYYSSIYPSMALSDPCQVITYDGVGNRVAETDAYYDGGTATCASGKGTTAPVSGLPVLPNGSPTHDENAFGSGAAAFRGNVTGLVKWSNNGASPTTSYTYDETGQPISMTDACGNTSCSDISAGGHTTTYSYSDNPGGGNSAGNSNAYLTLMTKPAANGIAQSEQFFYNYPDGVLTKSIDENTHPTNYYYYGPSGLNRLQQIVGPPDPNNGNQSSTTSYSYDDSTPSVTTTVLMSGGTSESSTATMDGLGHVVTTTKTEQPAANDDIVNFTYDGMGHVQIQTNPYRQGQSLSTNGSTTNTYDALGRLVIQKYTDGSGGNASTQQWCRDGFTSSGETACPANLSSHANSTWTDFYDETNRHWQRVSDAFGRLTAVMEPEASTTPTLETDYQYNLLDDLTKVDQWGGAPNSPNERIRTFAYDSLSRLTSACNPEAIATTASCANSGMTSDKYTYDANGNVATRVDGRAITTTYTYDVLNRITQKSYNDSPQTPAVGYLYDIILQGWGWPSGQQPQTNLVGRLSSVSVGSPNAWTVYGYDVMGHVTMKSECLPRTCGSDHYDMPYKYDLAGNMTSYTRGADFVRNTNTPNQGYYFGGFNIAYDPAGHINLVTADTTDANHPSVIYGSGVYTPLGAISTSTAVGIYLQARSYDFRGRYTGLDVINNSSQAIWNWTAGYYANSSVKNTVDPWNGSWTYLYGNTNRLAQVVGSAVTMAYTYDHWGNRTSQLITAGTGNETQWTNQQYNANNQLTTTWTNDAAGNVTYDGFHHYVYDAENRLVSVGTPNPQYAYAYDGENNRIAQLQSGVVQKEYLYDFQGRLMSEIGLDFKMARGNIYVGNELLAEDAPDPYRSSTPTATLLRITDQVGTLRAREDVGANWVGAYGSFPFNDNPNITNAPWGIPPENDMLFTGKQEDAESGLDYFGARYYNSLRGRFMSPDWADKPETVPYGDLKNPQSLNLYGYLNNDPLSKVDKDGHQACPACEQVVEDYATPYIQKFGDQAVGFLAGVGAAAAAKASGFFDAASDFVISHPLPILSSADPVPTQPYDTGTANGLRGNSEVGDNLDIHHVPQSQPASQTVEGYDKGTAPAIALPKGEHQAISPEKGEATRTPRDQLAKDVKDLRNHTNAPNSKIQEVIQINKDKYPEMNKP